MRRLAPLVPPLGLSALALALFGAWMHWSVVVPGNVGWLLAGDDRGQNAIGLAAFLRAGHWPTLHQPLLDAPEGLGLLFTDSIPLLGMVLGPVARAFPGELQFVGPWLLLCMMLQVGLAWALVRRHAPDAVAALLATALLAAMPALFNRYGHASLCAQWLILWSLWIYRDPARAETAGWWAAALAIAALIHSYLLLMVAGFWGSTLLRLVATRRPRQAIIAAVPGAAITLALLTWQGAFAGPYLSTGTYGAFPAALDAWWNPANRGFTGLMPSSPEDHGRGFEGLNYFGAGLLALVVTALARRMAGGAEPQRDISLAWLLPCFLVFAAVAVGPQPLWRGVPLATLHLPPWLTDALDPVRAAGRLMWPATYTIAFAAITATLRRPHATVILGAALAVQVVDLAPMLAAVRATSARADDRRVFTRTDDPRWPALIASARAVEFEPAEPFRDLQLMEEVAWRAVAACRPVRYFYASRETRPARARIDADAAAFRAGRLDPARLYVLLDGRAPAAVAARVRHVGGVAVIAPTAPAPPPGCLSPSPSSPRSAS